MESESELSQKFEEYRPQSITLWIQNLKSGNKRAAVEIHQRVVKRLEKIARGYFRGFPMRVYSEQDAVNLAFKSFFEGVENNLFPELKREADLWKTLRHITRCKVATFIESEMRQKRGGGNVRGESVFLTEDGEIAEGGLDLLEGNAVAPDVYVNALDTFEVLMERLEKKGLKEIAIMRSHGYRTREISERIKRVSRTVERKYIEIDKICRNFIRECHEEYLRERRTC